MKVAKAILAGIAAVVTILIAALSDDVVTAEEIGMIVTAVLSAIGVWAVPNRPS